jgi:hypothetical protein
VTIGFIYVGQKVEDERSEQFEQAGQLSGPGRTDVMRSGDDRGGPGHLHAMECDSLPLGIITFWGRPSAWTGAPVSRGHQLLLSV